MRIAHFICTALTLLIISVTTNANEKLYIGLDADMSSVAKAGGLAIKRGAELAIEDINHSGGILGRQVELIIKDHRGNPARGISNLKKLSKKDGLLAVLGGVHTPVVLQELDTIHDNKLVFLVPWAAGTPITSNGRTPNYVFRVSIRDKEAGPVLVNYASQISAKSIALVLERTGWGRSNEVSMTEAAKSAGISITGTHWVNWGQKDVSKLMADIADTKPDAIMMVANAPEGVVISKAVLDNELLAATPIISHWGIAGGSFVNGLGLDQLSKLNISTIQTFSFINAYNPLLSDALLKRYQAKYDESATSENIPGVVGLAQSYDLVHLLAKAVNSANSADRSLIRNALEKIDQHEGLIKHYTAPFSTNQHDALLRQDYFISTFDANGNIVPR